MKDEIVIDGIKYVKKESVKKPVEAERFSIAVEAKLHKIIKESVSEAENPISEFEALNREELRIIEPAKVMMIVAKSPRAKLFLRRYMESDSEPEKIPELDYKNLSESRSKYDISYLKTIFDFFRVLSDSSSVVLRVGKDYPLTVENEDFRFILAPKVD